MLYRYRLKYLMLLVSLCVIGLVVFSFFFKHPVKSLRRGGYSNPKVGITFAGVREIQFGSNIQVCFSELQAPDLGFQNHVQYVLIIESRGVQKPNVSCSGGVRKGVFFQTLSIERENLFLEFSNHVVTVWKDIDRESDLLLEGITADTFATLSLKKGRVIWLTLPSAPDPKVEISHFDAPVIPASTAASLARNESDVAAIDSVFLWLSKLRKNKNRQRLKEIPIGWEQD